MKKLILLLLVAVVFAACEKTDPVAEMENDAMLKKAVWKSMPDLVNGQHFELNLLGKKEGWNDKDVTNPERHTMFVPRNTEDWYITLEQDNVVINHRDTVGKNLGRLPGLRINMTQGEEFAVIDGNAFDEDKDCDFQLGPGEYYVFVAMRGKKNVDPPQIDGWLEVYDEAINEVWYYMNLGSVTVKRNWTDATDLFYIDADEAYPLPYAGGTQQWIFDYMEWLQDLESWDFGEGDVDVNYTDAAYFWQLQNNGSQLIKVRFYPKPS